MKPVSLIIVEAECCSSRSANGPRTLRVQCSSPVTLVYFSVKRTGVSLQIKVGSVGVPQGSCLDPLLFLMSMFSSQVFDKLKDIHNINKKTSSSSSSASFQHPPHPHLKPPSQSLPRPPRPLDSSVCALSHQLSKLGPLEDTYQPSQVSSSSSSSFCSLTPPHPLHSSSSSSTSSSSFVGPCETDESRGFSQYDLRSQLRSNGTSSRSLSPSTRDQYHSPTGSAESQFNQPSVPTEDQYNFPPQPSSTSDRSAALTGAPAGPDTRGQTPGGATARHYGVPECLSPVGSLKSSSSEPTGTSTAR